MITVIETTTSERKQEIINLFNEIKPYLDNGYSYMNALITIGKISPKVRNSAYNYGWYKEVVKYGESQGYPYIKYSGKGRCG